MYQIEIHRNFHASHALRLADGSLEMHHAHEWHTTVTVAASELDEIETVMDFHELERIADESMADLHHADLNRHPHFATVNPSAERVAELVFGRIAGRLPARVRLRSVAVTEAPGCRAKFVAED